MRPGEGKIRSEADRLRKALGDLGKKHKAGDDSELLVWVIPGALTVAHRPLRHHPDFGGSRRDLPPDAVSAVVEWVHQVRVNGIKGIISLMHPKELRHYARLDPQASDLIEFYRKEGFDVCHLPWEDRRKLCARLPQDARSPAGPYGNLPENGPA